MKRIVSVITLGLVGAERASIVTRVQKILAQSHCGRRACVLAALLIVATTGCHKHIATIIMERRVHSMQVPREHPTEMHYIVQLPRGYHDNTNRLWPLVFYLHGIGESGVNLDRVLRFGPPKLVAEGKDLPCIVVSPQVPRGYFWFRESNWTLEILEKVTRDYRVDKQRVHATGNSMGAFGAVLLVAREPQLFASCVPVCGGVDFMDALRLRDVPIWAFHGESDPIIPVEESKRMVDMVNKLGGHARLTIYPGVGHNSWDRAYDDPELWKWMLAQKRK